MPTFGLPTSMFLVFAATILAGSLAAIHYLIVHVILGRPFAEIPPPVVRDDPRIAPGTPAGESGTPYGESGTPGAASGPGDARG